MAQFGMKPAFTTVRTLAEVVEVYPNEDGVCLCVRDEHRNGQIWSTTPCKPDYERSRHLDANTDGDQGLSCGRYSAIDGATAGG